MKHSSSESSSTIVLLLIIANVWLALIWYTLYRNGRRQHEHFEVTKQETKKIQLKTTCDRCMSYIQPWWNANVYIPYRALKLSKAQEAKTITESDLKELQSYTADQIAQAKQLQIDDTKLQEAYGYMTDLLTFLVAPCILGWFNESPTKAIESARNINGLRSLTIQINTWWKENVFTPAKFTEDQYQAVRKYLMDQFNSCVDAQ
jgi:hypothetical protein